MTFLASVKRRPQLLNTFLWLSAINGTRLVATIVTRDAMYEGQLLISPLRKIAPRERERAAETKSYPQKCMLDASKY